MLIAGFSLVKNQYLVAITQPAVANWYLVKYYVPITPVNALNRYMWRCIYLFQGPHIAQVTLAAWECQSLDFPEPPYPNE